MFTKVFLFFFGFHFALALKCSPVVPMKTVLKIAFKSEHCTNTDNDDNSTTHGYFQVAAEISGDLYPRLKLAGRVVGPLISELKFVLDHKKHHWRAYYYLPINGKYLANVEIRYINFSIKDYENAEVHSTKNEIFTDFAFETSSNLNMTLSTKDCTLPDLNKEGFWRPMVTTKISSKWMLDPGNERPTNEQKYLFELLANNLIYQPRYCNMKQVQQCTDEASSQEIGFVGDSQMRHLSSDVYTALTDINIDFDNSIQKTDKSIHLTAHTHFIVDNFASMEFNDDELRQLSNCTVIVVNFGQWHLSWLMKIYFNRRPYSLSDFVHLVQSNLKRYRELFPSAKIFYLGTMAIGQNYRLYLPADDTRKDFRTDWILREFNAMAMDACWQVEGVRCLNMFEITNVVRDLSYDFSHFKAPVGPQLALALLTALCNDGL